MTDIYVNTDVVGPGAGTVGDPYKSLRTAWENHASHGAAPYTIYCSGVAVDAAAIDTNEFVTWSKTITIVGDSTTAGYEAGKYKCDLAYRSQQPLGAGVIHTLKNLQIVSNNKGSIAVQRGGAYRFDNCRIFIHGTSFVNTIFFQPFEGEIDAVFTNLVISDVMMSGDYDGGFNSGNIVILDAEGTSSYGRLDFYHPTLHITKNTSASSNYIPIRMDAAPVTIKNGILLRNNSATFFWSGSNAVLADTLVSGVTGTPTSINNDIIPGAAYDPYTLWENWDSGDYTLRGDATDAIDKCPDISGENGGITTDIAGNERVLPWDRGIYEASRGGPYPGEHTVTNTDNVTDPNCIYFGQDIEIGDVFSFKETTEINGWGADIDVDGYPIIDSQGGTGADLFLFDIDKGAGFVNPSEWNFAIQPTLTGLTVSDVTGDGCTVTVSTNSNQGKLYLSIRTAAQGGDYTEGDQALIRDGTVGVDCVYKDEVATPDYTVPQVFTVTGLDPGTTFHVGLAQDVDAV